MSVLNQGKRDKLTYCYKSIRIDEYLSRFFFILLLKIQYCIYLMDDSG